MQKYMKILMESGPDRVVINFEGEATSSRRAREVFGVSPDVVFLRNDGWMLGAPASLESVAFKIWRNEWIGFVRRPNQKFSPIKEYN